MSEEDDPRRRTPYQPGFGFALALAVILPAYIGQCMGEEEDTKPRCIRGELWERRAPGIIIRAEGYGGRPVTCREKGDGLR